MTRVVTVGAAQLGPISRTETRASAVARMVVLLDRAAAHGCDFVVFPECALTAFFPHWYYDGEEEIDAYFEREMPNAATQPLFDRARELGVGFYLGYAELDVTDGSKHRYNTSILVDKGGRVVGKYRKVHLPGHRDHEPGRPFQNLEKRYFEVGNLGFPVFRAFGGIVGMAICNDRRWPETYRMLCLNGAEVALIGYNTPLLLDEAPELAHLRMFHNHLPMQAGAYQNTLWVAAAAKAGLEDGQALIGGSCIIAPTGEIAAQAISLDDEVIVHRADLDLISVCQKVNFDFAKYRRPDQYRLIADQA